MNEQTLMWVLGGLVAIALLLIGWLKFDQKSVNRDLWDRANFHGHTIECDSDSCKGAETKDVVIRRP
jgi:hypothetical protein